MNANDPKKPNQPTTRERAEKIADQIAEGFENITSNGNREETTGKPGSAQRGGPDLDKAQKQQPPDAETRRHDAEITRH